MSILAGNELLKEIKRRNIIITPLNESSIGLASVDLRLSYAIRVYKNIYNPIKLKEGIKVYQFIFQRIIGKARYSGQFKVQTPDDFINDL